VVSFFNGVGSGLGNSLMCIIMTHEGVGELLFPGFQLLFTGDWAGVLMEGIVRACRLF
jgi:hypothetical protein